MVLQTQFICPDKHSFTANAKLRARCPECGKMARKSFTAPPTKPDPEPETPIESQEPESPAEPKKIQVLRQGRSVKPKVRVMPHKVNVKVEAKKGLVRHKTVRRAVIPTVRGKPTGNREHKVATAIGEDRPYWHEVAEKYWGR